MTPEGRVKAKVNKALKPFIDRGVMWKMMPVQMGMGIPALDYLLCLKGLFVAIETKVEGKNLTPRQMQTKEAMEQAGGKVYVVYNDETLQSMVANLHLWERFGDHLGDMRSKFVDVDGNRYVRAVEIPYHTGR